jgi:hypothetical protein
MTHARRGSRAKRTREGCKRRLAPAPSLVTEIRVRNGRVPPTDSVLPTKIWPKSDDLATAQPPAGSVHGLRFLDLTKT